jgi:ribosomal protein S18 acetylase RimI-like enzyme
MYILVKLIMPEQFKIMDLERDAIPEAFAFDWRGIRANNSTGVAVGIFDDAELVGLILFKRLLSDKFNYVENLEVIPSHRGQTFGAKLLAYVMLDSLNNPVTEGFVSLETKRNNVLNFYKHLGGKQIGRSSLILFEPSVSSKVIQKYLHQGDANNGL